MGGALFRRGYRGGGAMSSSMTSRFVPGGDGGESSLASLCEWVSRGSGKRMSGGHSLSLSKWTTSRCRRFQTFSILYVASEMRRTTRKGPVHGRRNFLAWPRGVAGEWSHTSSPTLYGFPCTFLSYRSFWRSSLWPSLSRTR